MPEVFEVPGGYLFGKTKTVSTVISVCWRKNTRVRVRVGSGLVLGLGFGWFVLAYK